MSERDHALLSASSAHRWLKCTPSARLEESLPDTESESAAEGTLAHAIAELKLRNMAIEPMPKRTFNSRMKKLKADPLYQKEMDRYTDEYVDYIREIMLQYNVAPFVRAEMEVDFSKYAPEGFGTADCILIAGREMHIVDFKYGKNVAVSALDNPQLMLYALGAMEEFALFYDIHHVYMHIFQPRAYEEAEQKSFMLAKHLKAWGAEIKDKAAAAFEGTGEQVVGDHCQFCRAKAICRKQADANLALARHEFKEPPLLNNYEVGDILLEARNLASWVKKLEDWALSQLLTGAVIPGWKAVEGRGSRNWSDQEKAFQAIIDGGIPKTMLYENKPLSVAALEKEIGGKELYALAGDMIVKTAGKPALVEESDKRQAITNKTSAQEDFKNE